jgi:hypothetical protein
LPATAQGEITLEERIARRGHRPAIFTLSGERKHAEELERALVQRGFEAVLIEHQNIPTPARGRFFAALWKVGLLILSWRDRPLRPREQAVISGIAGDSYFDASGFQSLAAADFHHRALEIAETLRYAGRQTNPH